MAKRPHKRKRKNSPPAFPRLTAYADEIGRCFRCGLCRTVCPTYAEEQSEGASPRGRVQLARAVLEETIPPDERFRARMNDCLTCMRCAEICPGGIRPDRIVLAARADMVDRAGRDGFQRMIAGVLGGSSARLSLLMGAGRLARSCAGGAGSGIETTALWVAGLGDKLLPPLDGRPAMARLPELNPSIVGAPRMRVGYFVGCATNRFYPQVAEATVQVLNRLGVEVVIPRGQVCCGLPHTSSGDTSTARHLMEKNSGVFRGQTIDCIISDCSSCSAALKSGANDSTGAPRFSVPVYDLLEFLTRVIEVDLPLGALPETVTYHDPCHLRREQGIVREPRDLINRIPGVTFIELPDADRCCGGAGTYLFTHPTEARAIGAAKADAIRGTGARVVATPCPACRMQIEDVLRHAGLTVRVVHPVELLDASMNCADRMEDSFLLVNPE